MCTINTCSNMIGWRYYNVMTNGNQNTSKVKLLSLIVFTNLFIKITKDMTGYKAMLMTLQLNAKY